MCACERVRERERDASWERRTDSRENEDTGRNGEQRKTGGRETANPDKGPTRKRATSKKVEH